MKCICATSVTRIRSAKTLAPHNGCSTKALAAQFTGRSDMAIDSIDDLSRRELLTRSAVLAALLALAGPIFLRGAVARAQDHPAEKVYRIGFLRAGPPPKTWVKRFSKDYGSADTP